MLFASMFNLEKVYAVPGEKRTTNRLVFDYGTTENKMRVEATARLTSWRPAIDVRVDGALVLGNVEPSQDDKNRWSQIESKLFEAETQEHDTKQASVLNRLDAINGVVKKR